MSHLQCLTVNTARWNKSVLSTVLNLNATEKRQDRAPPRTGTFRIRITLPASSERGEVERCVRAWGRFDRTKE
jgi:hypothetical protein